MFKRFLLLVLLVGFGMGNIHAQDEQGNCDLGTFDEYVTRGYDAYLAYDYHAAAADYECALLLDPENIDLIAGLGAVYYFVGDYEKSIENFTIALEIDPNNQDVRLIRAYIYTEQGLYAEALADANLMLEIDSNFAEAYLSRAWVYVYSGEEGTMHADFLRWLELTEQNRFELSLADAANYENLPIAEWDVYAIRFEGEAGTSFRAAASSQDNIDPLLVLIAPDGTPINSDDDGGVNLNAVISRFDLPQTGEYTLVLGQAGAYGSGTIELSVVLGNDLVSTNGESTGDVRSDFAEYNLFVGDLAEVFTTEGDRLNLRAEPSIEAEIIDRLEYGEVVTLLEGPRKEGGYSWWRIRTADGQEGWSVERVEVEQTLQLALLQGEEALVVTQDELLNVRDAASRSGEVVFQLADGAVITILDEAPVIADGLRWWHIRDAEGREGWAVDHIGIERTIAPVREFQNR